MEKKRVVIRGNGKGGRRARNGEGEKKMEERLSAIGAAGRGVEGREGDGRGGGGRGRRGGCHGKCRTRNAWGNESYAQIIERAIKSSRSGQMTLAEIYDWIVKNVEYFRQRMDVKSSEAWKNSIRHNLSLHPRFIRLMNDGRGKSSPWKLDPNMTSSRRPSSELKQSVNKSPQSKRLHSNNQSQQSVLHKPLFHWTPPNLVMDKTHCDRSAESTGNGLARYVFPLANFSQATDLNVPLEGCRTVVALGDDWKLKDHVTEFATSNWSAYDDIGLPRDIEDQDRIKVANDGLPVDKYSSIKIANDSFPADKFSPKKPQPYPDCLYNSTAICSNRRTGPHPVCCLESKVRLDVASPLSDFQFAFRQDNATTATSTTVGTAAATETTSVGCIATSGATRTITTGATSIPRFESQTSSKGKRAATTSGVATSAPGEAAKNPTITIVGITTETRALTTAAAVATTTTIATTTASIVTATVAITLADNAMIVKGFAKLPVNTAISPASTSRHPSIKNDSETSVCQLSQFGTVNSQLISDQKQKIYPPCLRRDTREMSFEPEFFDLFSANDDNDDDNIAGDERINRIGGNYVRDICKNLSSNDFAADVNFYSELQSNILSPICDYFTNKKSPDSITPLLPNNTSDCSMHGEARSLLNKPSAFSLPCQRQLNFRYNGIESKNEISRSSHMMKSGSHPRCDCLIQFETEQLYRPGKLDIVSREIDPSCESSHFWTWKPTEPNNLQNGVVASHATPGDYCFYQNSASFASLAEATTKGRKKFQPPDDSDIVTSGSSGWRLGEETPVILFGDKQRELFDRWQ